MRPMEEIKDRLGWTHYKYQQYHQNIPVVGARYSLHTKDGQVLRSSGVLYPSIRISTNPEVNEIKIQEHAKQIFAHLIRKQMGRVLAENISIRENAKLCIIDSTYPEFSGSYQLAYKVVLDYSDGALPIAKTLYLSAENATYINAFDEILHESVPAKGMSNYYAEVSFNTKRIGPDQYILEDTERNIIIADFLTGSEIENNSTQ